MKKIKFLDVITIGNVMDFLNEETIKSNEDTTKKFKSSWRLFVVWAFSSILIWLMSLLTKILYTDPEGVVVASLKKNIYYVQLNYIIYATTITAIISFYYIMKFKKVAKYNRYEANLNYMKGMFVALIGCYIYILCFSCALLLLILEKTLGTVLVSLLITFGVGLNIFYSIVFFKKGRNDFLKITEESPFTKKVNSLVKKISPFIGIMGAISFATASSSSRKDFNDFIMSIFAPYTLFLVIFFSYGIFHWMLQFIYNYYTVCLFPEPYRKQLGETKEEFYGPEYFKSKDVMSKIKEYEKYSKEKELGINE